MKALSIRQPWASLLAAGIKDIENRSWRTSHRGPFLIHAAAGMTKHEYRDVFAFLRHRFGEATARRIVPARFDLPRGGIVGMATIADVVTASRSKRFVGPVGFVLTDAVRLPFQPCLGRLGFFTPEPTDFTLQLTP